MNKKYIAVVITTLAVFLVAFFYFSLNSKDKIKVACVGDSVTFGFSIESKDSHSYPAQLQQLLGDNWDVKNFGRNSATVLTKGDYPTMSLPEYKAALKFKPEVVVILLGANDSKPFNWQYKADFKSDYAALIQSFRSLGSVTKVYICKPIPVIKDRWNIQEKVVEGEMQTLIEEIANENDVTLIDLFRVFKDKEHLIHDDIHPNVEGAGIIAENVAQSLSEYAQLLENTSN